MKIRNARTGEQIVIHVDLDNKRKKQVWQLLGLPLEIWEDIPAREALWKWYCLAPLDEIFIRTGYEVRLSLGAVLVPKQEYVSTVPSRKGDTDVKRK